MAWEVNVAANRLHLIALGDRLTLPFGLHRLPRRRVLPIATLPATGSPWPTFHVKQCWRSIGPWQPLAAARLLAPSAAVACSGCRGPGRERQRHGRSLPRGSAVPAQEAFAW